MIYYVYIRSVDGSLRPHDKVIGADSPSEAREAWERYTYDPDDYYRRGVVVSEKPLTDEPIYNSITKKVACKSERD